MDETCWWESTEGVRFLQSREDLESEFKEWLTNKGVYKVGDIFEVFLNEVPAGDAVICQVGYGAVSLIGMSSWNRYSEPVKVGGIREITQNEFSTMIWSAVGVGYVFKRKENDIE